MADDPGSRATAMDSSRTGHGWPMIRDPEPKPCAHPGQAMDGRRSGIQSQSDALTPDRPWMAVDPGSRATAMRSSRTGHGWPMIRDPEPKRCAHPGQAMDGRRSGIQSQSWTHPGQAMDGRRSRPAGKVRDLWQESTDSKVKMDSSLRWNDGEAIGATIVLVPGTGSQASATAACPPGHSRSVCSVPASCLHSPACAGMTRGGVGVEGIRAADFRLQPWSTAVDPGLLAKGSRLRSAAEPEACQPADSITGIHIFPHVIPAQAGIHLDLMYESGILHYYPKDRICSGRCTARTPASDPPGYHTLMRERLPCVYVLASSQRGTLYVGVTSNLPKRVFQHRNALVDGFSRRHRVHDLVWYELHETLESAIQREKALKAWRRAWKIRLIEESNPEWRDLYTSLVREEPT